LIHLGHIYIVSVGAPMNDSCYQLSGKLIEASRKFYEAVEHYYAVARDRANTSPLKSAAQECQIAGESYLAALSDCEHHLQSVPQDNDNEIELKLIRNRQVSIAAIMKSLK
jgi:hypothetical protein